MSAGEDLVFQTMFQVGVYAQIEQNLYDLVLKIGKDTPLSRSYNLQQLNLPLISNDYDKEDVMLLTALALGDDDLVERITKVFTKQKLGIGLTKFSARQIRKVIKALKSAEEPKIDVNIVGLIVGLGIYDDEFHSFRSGNPAVAFIREEYKISDYKALSDAARKCGFYLLNKSNFTTKIRGDKNTIQYSLCNRLKSYQLKLLVLSVVICGLLLSRTVKSLNYPGKLPPRLCLSTVFSMRLYKAVAGKLLRCCITLLAGY